MLQIRLDERTITPAYFINLILYFVTNPASNIGDRDNSVMVFASPSGHFLGSMTNSRRLSGLIHPDNFIVTRKSCPFTWTLQKPQQQLIQMSIRQYQSNFVVRKTKITHNNILNVKQISILFILTVLLSFKIDNGNKLNESSDPSVNSLLNKKVPHFTGYLINESVVDETFLDKKVILLNFMFIGCQGCMQELPNLDKLHEKYKNTNFMIVTIMGNGIEDIKSYQGMGDTAKVFYQIRKMLKSESIRNPIIAECKSVRQTGSVNSIKTCTDNISKKFFIREYPTNLLVDKSGIITKIYSNLVDDAEYIDIQAQIDSLLN